MRARLARTAMVVAVAGGARKVGLVRELGAAHAIDYSSAGWEQRVRDAVGAVDIVFDGVGGEIGAGAFGLLDRGGRLFSYGLASGTWTDVSAEAAAARGVSIHRDSLGSPADLRRFTERILLDAANGRVRPAECSPTGRYRTGVCLTATPADPIRPVIGQRFPLAEAARAHRAIESRATIGKTLLVV